MHLRNQVPELQLIQDPAALSVYSLEDYVEFPQEFLMFLQLEVEDYFDELPEADPAFSPDLFLLGCFLLSRQLLYLLDLVKCMITRVESMIENTLIDECGLCQLFRYVVGIELILFLLHLTVEDLVKFLYQQTCICLVIH